ncbi:hypothetical protein S83_027704 [Arachis hypogaea]
MAERDSKAAKTTTTPIISAADDDIDRISSLPHCLLCHILSFLPTQTPVIVATTSVLSRRWRNVWKDMEVFKFQQKKKSQKSLFYSVKSVLTLRRPGRVRKFRLESDVSEANLVTVKNWINAAMGPQLEELHLLLSRENNDNLPLAPTLLISCSNSIAALSREWYLYFPSLKSLSLNLGSTQNVDVLLSRCPVLETLNLKLFISTCPDLRVQKLRVASSSLKSLTITALSNYVIEGFELDAPSLENLSLLFNRELEGFSVRNLHSVRNASLDFRFTAGGYSVIELAMKILEKCRVLKDLTVHRRKHAYSKTWREPIKVPSSLVDLRSVNLTMSILIIKVVI